MSKKTVVESNGKAMSADERAFNNTIGQIEKAFGAGAIMKLGDGSSLAIEGISTGAISLDLALGGRGLPKGRIIELFGPESSGKTTIALHAVANAQKNGGRAVFIDAEHALDPSWCKKLGVDIENLMVSQPSSAEEALQIAEMLVMSNADRHHRDRLGRRPGPQGGDRGGDRRQPRRPPGAVDEPGAPEADRRRLASRSAS